jgi:hypothetical protein
VGGAKLDLRFWREAEQTRWEVAAQEGAIEVAQRAWEPWPTATA